MNTAEPVIDTTLLASAATAELDDWGPVEEATGKPQHAFGIVIWSSPDGAREAGVWECTAGPSYYVQDSSEFVYILSGTLTVTADGGQPRDLRPGDSAMFPQGWRGTWDLHETVRKLYVTF